MKINIKNKKVKPWKSLLCFVCFTSPPTSYILPDASRQSGQKTRAVKRSISPVYNHTMVYDGFQPSDLVEACAELTVWQREGLKMHMLGGIRLSYGTGENPPQTQRYVTKRSLLTRNCTKHNREPSLHLLLILNPETT